MCFMLTLRKRLTAWIVSPCGESSEAMVSHGRLSTSSGLCMKIFRVKWYVDTTFNGQLQSSDRGQTRVYLNTEERDP